MGKNSWTGLSSSSDPYRPGNEKPTLHTAIQHKNRKVASGVKDGFAFQGGCNLLNILNRLNQICPENLLKLDLYLPLFALYIQHVRNVNV